MSQERLPEILTTAQTLTTGKTFPSREMLADFITEQDGLWVVAEREWVMEDGDVVSANRVTTGPSREGRPRSLTDPASRDSSHSW